MDLEDRKRVKSIGLQIELLADSVKMSGHIIEKSDKVYYENELREEVSRIERGIKGLTMLVDSIKRMLDPEGIVKPDTESDEMLTYQRIGFIDPEDWQPARPAKRPRMKGE